MKPKTRELLEKLADLMEQYDASIDAERSYDCLELHIWVGDERLEAHWSLDGKELRGLIEEGAKKMNREDVAKFIAELKAEKEEALERLDF